MRILTLIVIAALAAALSACGDAGQPSAAPDVQVGKLTGTGAGGRSNEADSGTTPQKPGYKQLLERQSSKPATRFSPCSLVTRGQAGAILGARVLAPFEAPQGPTCIYRSKSGHAFVTLAVQPLDFDTARRRLRGGAAVDVAGRSAYCGRAGQPTLYVKLPRGRVLSVSATCSIAQKFAARAVAQLRG